MGRGVGAVGGLFAAGMVLYALREFRKLDEVINQPAPAVAPAPRRDDPRADNDFLAPPRPLRRPWTLDDQAFELTVTFPGRATRAVDAGAHGWGYDGPKKARYDFTATPRARPAANELAAEAEWAIDRLGKRGYVLTDRRDVTVGRLPGYELTFAKDHPTTPRTRREWGVRGADHFYRIEAEADPTAFDAGDVAEFFESVTARPRGN
jgi:hypothetical protein